MSIPFGSIPFDITPIVVKCFFDQVSFLALVARARAERKRLRAEHLALDPHEQYRRHIANGGYRP